MEILELVELLPGGGKFDRLAGDGLDGERRAAAGVTVELRQDDAVEIDRLRERLRDVDGVLTRHCVEDEEDVVRLRGSPHPRELIHHLLVDMEAPRGVEDYRVPALRPGLLDALLNDRDGILRGLV